MKILITGGTGLIGNRLTTQLALEEHQLVILTRGERAMTNANIHFVQWDGKTINAEAVKAAVGDVDAIINLAGAGVADQKWSASYKQTIINSRVNAGKAVVAFINGLEKKPSVLVQATAVGYYGTHASRVFTEKDGAGKDFLARACVKWEDSVKDAGIRTVWVRIGVVLAPEGGAFPKLLSPFKFYAGGYLGDGRQPFPWIHINDILGIMRYALTHEDMQGVYNAVAPMQMTNRSFARMLGTMMGKPSGLPVPAFAVRTMLGEQAMIVLEGQHVSSQKLQDLGYEFLYPEAKEALTHLLSV